MDNWRETPYTGWIKKLLDTAVYWRWCNGERQFVAGAFNFPQCKNCGSLDIEYEFPVGFFGSEEYGCNCCGGILMREVEIVRDTEGNELSRRTINETMPRYSLFSVADFI